MECDFSFNHYKKILENIKSAGYKSTFYDEEIKGKQIIIRHDIDLDFDAALELAKIEASLGIKAVYFIWIGSPFYNIFEKRYKNIIYTILELGHEIGLHYDETAYEYKTMDELIFNIDNECKVLNNYFDIDIKTISFHRPSEFILNNDLNCGKYINAYSKKFFKEYFYISDSRGRWRNGCICSKINKDFSDKVHLLTHPIWWKNDNLNSYEKVQEFLQFKLSKMKMDITDNEVY